MFGFFNSINLKLILRLNYIIENRLDTLALFQEARSITGHLITVGKKKKQIPRSKLAGTKSPIILSKISIQHPKVGFGITSIRFRKGNLFVLKRHEGQI